MKQILFLIAICTTKVIYCQQGFVDNSFGNNGFVAGNFPSQINSILIANERILATGGFDASGQLVASILQDGSLDSTFGQNGFASLNESTGGGLESVINFDNKLLVCGGRLNENQIFESFIAKFTSNGKPDSSFGINGTSIIPLYNSSVSYNQMALAPDGSIIVGGVGVNNDFTRYIIISKLSAGGIFDNTLGDNGYIFNSAFYNIKDLAIQPDGKIVVAGQNSGNDFVFSRYSTDGSLDKSFGINGIETFIIGGDDSPEKIIIQLNGKLMIGGYTATDKYKMCALRLNPNGSLDETFGDGGKVLVDFEDSTGRAYDMVQQPDGKFILAGAAYDKGQNGSYFGLCRITNDGRLDSSFGVNGLQTTAFSNGGEAYTAALQNDGKIVLGGYYQPKKGEPSYLIVRYNNEFNKKQIIITKIKKWLQHRNGFTWDANSTINSYTIQRSYDGIHYNSLSRINTANRSNYSYADPSPLSGTNYYRLQTTSNDGAVNYSNIIAITNSDIKISPNPAKNSLQIQGMPSNQKIKLSVVDFSGFTAISQQLSANRSSSYNLNIASLKAGNYLLKIEMNDETVTKKFVKE